MHALEIENSEFQSPQNAINLLVFPLDLDESQYFTEQAKSLGLNVIGASSVMRQATDLNVDEFAYLPYVTADDFDSAFDKLINQYSITHVYTPHSGVWNHIEELLLSSKDYRFHLCTPKPFDANWLKYKPSYDWVKKVQADTLAGFLANGSFLRGLLSEAHYSALHKQFRNIPGQCDDDKLLSLSVIMRLIPQGDIVEIGSLYGRSAYAFAYLAKKYHIGNVISVDPWKAGKIKPQGNQAKLLNKQIGEVDPDIIFQIFLANAALLDNLTYIREASEQAVTIYINNVEEGFVKTPELGRFSVTGEIALLHIDGNHKYEEVCKDIDNWIPHVKPGGWVLLDDYVWAFGDGPKRAGDELIKKNIFDLSFCLGDTLFLRKSIGS